MGRPKQLTKQQVEQIKKSNDGSPVSKEQVIVKANEVFSKELEINENDVFLLDMIKL
jgi:xylan 1,4-beta-xylosidase